MKIDVNPNRQITASNTLDQRSFSVNTNAHMINTLTDKLYSDKSLAVVRELCSNALDANIENKSDKPVDVTNAGGQFKVRDYGSGMDHDFIMEVYTSFFTSTKGESNFVTGAYGLGSKSPFAITDQFTISTRTKDDPDNTKRVYTCAKDADGMPVVHFIGSFTSKEEYVSTGTTVSLRVSSDVTSALSEAITHMGPTFLRENISINVKRASDYYSSEITIYPGIQEVFSLYAFNTTIAPSLPISIQGNTSSGAGVSIIMGSGSPLVLEDNANIPVGVRKHFQNIKRFFAVHIYINVPIGSISVPPSRESIEWDKKTIAYISQLLTDISTSIDAIRKKYAFGVSRDKNEAFSDKFPNICSSLLRRANVLRQVHSYMPDNKLVTSITHTDTCLSVFNRTQGVSVSAQPKFALIRKHSYYNQKVRAVYGVTSTAWSAYIKREFAEVGYTLVLDDSADDIPLYDYLVSFILGKPYKSDVIDLTSKADMKELNKLVKEYRDENHTLYPPSSASQTKRAHRALKYMVDDPSTYGFRTEPMTKKEYLSFLEADDVIVSIGEDIHYSHVKSALVVINILLDTDHRVDRVYIVTDKDVAKCKGAWKWQTVQDVLGAAIADNYSTFVNMCANRVIGTMNSTYGTKDQQYWAIAKDIIQFGRLGDISDLLFPFKKLYNATICDSVPVTICHDKDNQIKITSLYTISNLDLEKLRVDVLRRIDKIISVTTKLRDKYAFTKLSPSTVNTLLCNNIDILSLKEKSS